MSKNLKKILGSSEAMEAFREIQSEGTLSSIPGDVSSNAKCFLIGELFVRESRYNEISVSLPVDADEWWKRLAVCTGYLFTSPLSALKELEWLEDNCTDGIFSYRLTVWRMHLYLLVGHEEAGKSLRWEIETNLPEDFPWIMERMTLLAISYFSTAECQSAVNTHIECLDLLNRYPEQFFQAFGTAIGMRAALKVCDAQGFEVLSNSLDQALKKRPDDRYRLRQHSYRAMVLTQLGEKELAERYWRRGDQLLEVVDKGAATVERGQYLIFRCLAASLLGDVDFADDCAKRAEKELLNADVYAIHMAELNVCRILAPIANPHLRSSSVGRSYESLNEAISICSDLMEETSLDSIRLHYEEARRFCESLLSGDNPQREASRGDKWRTLTVSVIDNFQRSAEFAKQIGYFRLIPKFIDELEKTSLDTIGINEALTAVMPFPPRMNEDGFQLSVEQEEMQQFTQLDSLMKFANTLNSLAQIAKVSARSNAIAETVQTIIHEVKRPFHLLNMSLDAASKCDDPKKIKIMIENTTPLVREASDRVEQLMKEILTIEEPGQVELTHIEPSDLVITAINQVKSSRGSALNISTNFQADRRFVGDRKKLIRAVENLLDNAADASPKGIIEVFTENSDLNGKPAILYSVMNDAYVPKDDQRRVFEKSFTKGKANGTGLGLAIVKGIVNAHQGEIQFESNKTKGTRVSFLVPAEINVN